MWSDTKSPAGERQLPLPDLVGEALADFRAAQVTEKPDAGERYEDNGYGLGRALNGRQLRERAYTDMTANSLRRVRSCDARASCFTYLANKGVPDHLLARWAGHTDVRTTRRWYVKPDVEDLRPAAATWGELASAPPRSRSECEMWEREWVSEKNVEPLQYRFDGLEDAPVLVIGPSLGATWHR